VWQANNINNKLVTADFNQFAVGSIPAQPTKIYQGLVRNG